MQYGYQCLLPEAIAIVVAPKFQPGYEKFSNSQKYMKIERKIDSLNN